MVVFSSFRENLSFWVQSKPSNLDEVVEDRFTEFIVAVMKESGQE